jgi:hypothetical protein
MRKLQRYGHVKTIQRCGIAETIQHTSRVVRVFIEYGGFQRQTSNSSITIAS